LQGIEPPPNILNLYTFVGWIKNRSIE
jgi:hypothetical protein